MTYKVIKINALTEEEFNMGGGYTEQDVKDITRGYKFNGLWYDRAGSKWMFIVEAE